MSGMPGPNPEHFQPDAPGNSFTRQEFRHGTWARQQASTPFLPSADLPRPWLLPAIFLLLGAMLSSLGWWAYKVEAEHQRQQGYQTLTAIADFKAAQIGDWLAERRSDLLSVTDSRFFREDCSRWLKDGESRFRERLEVRLEALRANDNYVGAELLDRGGNLRLVVGPVRSAPEENTPERMHRFRDATEPQLIDLHQAAGGIHLSYVAPIREAPGRPPLGYLRLTIDPNRHLYPRIRSWPVASESAETLLVRREGDDVLFLNDLRHRPDTALRLRLPLTRQDLPATRAAQGETGIFEGKDYRGVEVLSYLRAIPDTPWQMVTKVDRREVFAGIEQTAKLAGLGVAVLIVSSGLLLGGIWYRQQSRARLAVEQGLARIAELAPGVLYTFQLKPDGGVSFPYASPGIEALAGFTPGQLARDTGPMRARIHPDDIRTIDRQIAESARTGLPWREEFRYAHPTKGEIWLEGQSAPERQPDGSIIWYGFFSDITARRMAEEKLRRRNEELEALMEAVPVPVLFSHDPDCRMIIGNRAGNELFGVPDGTNVSMSAEPHLPLFKMFEYQGGRELVPDELPIQQVARQGRPVSGLERYLRFPDGREVWLLCSAVPLFDMGGHVRGVVGGFIDITLRKAAQSALEANQARLEEEVRRRTADLERANSHLRAFSYAASHDLKAPLRGINSFAGLLERRCRDKLVGDEQMFLDQICKSAAKMTALIDDLLAHAQLEQQALAAEPVDLAAAVHAVLREREQEIQDCDADIRLDLPAMKVLADPQGLIQVLRNLVGNALKYSSRQPAPVIEISAERDPRRCLVRIGDNGVGFDMAYRESIFEIFRRLHTYDEFPGSGIGLALVRKTLERMGGKVWAESAPGQGAVFFFELPLAHEAAGADRSAPACCP